jgi:hypothetical protein
MTNNVAINELKTTLGGQITTVSPGRRLVASGRADPPAAGVGRGPTHAGKKRLKGATERCSTLMVNGNDRVGSQQADIPPV